MKLVIISSSNVPFTFKYFGIYHLPSDNLNTLCFGYEISADALNKHLNKNSYDSIDDLELYK